MVLLFGVGDTAANHLLSDGHPPVIGYALEGFAIHSSYAAAGHGALDSCNGHADAPRGYHCHATATSPYLIGCYAGMTALTCNVAMHPCVPAMGP